MIRWLVQTVADHPDLTSGYPPVALLAPAEWAHYHTLLYPRRRRDWLLGRWTAKRLAQAHIRATKGFCPTLDSFTITYNRNGAPTIAGGNSALCGPRNGDQLPLALSISHSSGYAFCALATNDLGTVQLGADIEVVEPRPDAFARDFFTAAEQANIDIAPAALRPLLTTVTWSAKEATLKATQSGLRADPRSLQCLIRPACPHHWTPLHIEMEPALRTQLETERPLRGWWRIIDNRLRPGTHFVLTIAAFGATL